MNTQAVIVKQRGKKHKIYKKVKILFKKCDKTHFMHVSKDFIFKINQYFQ